MKREAMTPARIAKIRAGLRLTQQELATECGVSLRAVQQWLYDGPNPSQGRAPQGPAVRLLEQLEAKVKERERNRKP